MDSGKINRRRGLGLVVLSSVTFGVVPVLVVRCYEMGANSTTFLLLRYGMVLFLLLPFVRPGGDLLRLWKRNWTWILFLAAAGIATTVLVFGAYRYIPTGMVTTIHFMYPTVVTLICLLFLREKASWRKLVSVALCLAGILLLGARWEELRPAGVLMAGASSVTYALYIIGADRFPPGELTAVQLMFSVELFSLILVGGLYGPLTGALFVEMPLLGWPWLAFCAAVHGLLGQMLFLLGVRDTGAQLAAIASTLEPITSIVMGVLFLHEPVSFSSLAGSGLILAAIAVAVWKGE